MGGSVDDWATMNSIHSFVKLLLYLLEHGINTAKVWGSIPADASTPKKLECMESWPIIETRVFACALHTLNL